MSDRNGGPDPVEAAIAQIRAEDAIAAPAEPAPPSVTRIRMSSGRGMQMVYPSDLSDTEIADIATYLLTMVRERAAAFRRGERPVDDVAPTPLAKPARQRLVLPGGMPTPFRRRS